MITAYCIHTSEGMPIRRVLETKLNESSIDVTITDHDWDWNKKARVQSYSVPTKHQPWYKIGDNVLELYHRRFRHNMNQQHNWRFEIYWPLSSLN